MDRSRERREARIASPETQEGAPDTSTESAAERPSASPEELEQAVAEARARAAELTEQQAVVLERASTEVKDYSKEVLGTALMTTAILTYKFQVKPMTRGILRIVDWVGRQLDERGKKAMGQGGEYLNPIANVIGNGIDWTKKKLGVEKSYGELLQQNEKARQEEAAKLLKEFESAEKAHEKKVDSAKKAKAKREEKERMRKEALERRFGKKNAELLMSEMDRIEVAEAAAEPAEKKSE